MPDSQPHLWEVSPPGSVSAAVDILIEQLAGMMDPSMDIEEVRTDMLAFLQQQTCLHYLAMVMRAFPSVQITVVI